MIAFNVAKQLTPKQKRSTGRPQRPMVILTPDQIPALIKAASAGGDYFGPMVFAALFTGMRLGELQGLLWRDVHVSGEDSERPYIVVRGQLERTKDEATGEMLFGQRGLKSKEDGFTRTVHIEHKLARVLREWFKRCGRIDPEAFVFVSERNGSKPASDSTIRENFYRARQAAGIDPGFCFHHMRDTYASMLLAGYRGEEAEEDLAGRPLPGIALLLGHTKRNGQPNPETTLRHYAHLFDLDGEEDATRKLLEKLAEAI